MTDAELERLAILVEEAAEVQQIAMKIIRHGYDSCNPFDADKTTNQELLQKELGDLTFGIQMRVDEGDINRSDIAKHRAKKKKNIRQYLHHNIV